jgi:transposase
MIKYSLDIKIKAVKHYLKGMDSYKSTAEKFKVNISMLKGWVALYQEYGLDGLRKKYTHYDVRFKIDVINYMNDTGASSVQAAAKFNIPSSRTVRKWKTIVETKGIDALDPKKKGRPTIKKETKKTPPVEGTQEALLAENERLRIENVYLKKLHALIQEKEKLQNKTKRK